MDEIKYTGNKEWYKLDLYMEERKMPRLALVPQQ
jgi:hypothetical protein